MDNFSKEHSNGEVTVVWKPRLCIHSGICVRGLAMVFQPHEKPWIKMDGASTESIIEQVKACPSGALSFFMNHENVSDAQMDAKTIEVQVLKNGPYLVRGEIIIQHSDGSSEVKESSTALCRCGASLKKPYCDGAHRNINFEG